MSSSSSMNPPSLVAASKSIQLSHLPLRPSTLSILTRHGFITAQDVLDCCGPSSSSSQAGGGGGGATVSSLATELNVSLSVAASILREVHSLVLNTTSSSLQQQHNDTKKPTVMTAASILQQVLPPTLSSSTSTTTTTVVPPLRPIVSFVQSIDLILGGGFFPREVTEIVGAPGSGKTQMAMQLCVDARLPPDFGGVAGGAMYLDTEGSFSPERCWDMAKALVEHVHASAKKSLTKAAVVATAEGVESATSVVVDDSTTTNVQATIHKKKKMSHPTTIKTVPPHFTPETILDGIHVFPIHDEETQTTTIMALSHHVEQFYKEKGFPIKIVVVDSIAFHYRSIASDSKTRTRSILSLVHSLSDLANKYDLAVVLVNQMTTQVLPSASTSYLSNKTAPSSSYSLHPQNQNPDVEEDTSTTVMEGNFKLIPALGASFAHSTTTRLLLMQDFTEYILKDPDTSLGVGVGGVKIPKRICKLIKSPHKPAAIAYYSVTDCGIRDWPNKAAVDGKDKPSTASS